MASLAVGCEGGTSILLVIDGDLRPVADADEITLRGSGQGRDVTMGPHALTEARSLPQTVRIVPGESVTESVEVSVTASLRSAEILVATRTFAFIQDEHVEHRICLWRRCIGSVDDACLEGRCDGADGDADVDADGDGDGDGDADADADSDADADTDADVVTDSEWPCTTESCDDGEICNGQEVCTATGCVDGPDPVLSDDIDCTIDRCAEPEGVTHEPDHSLCLDEIGCTVNERCDSVSGCIWDPLDSDDDGYGAELCGGDDCDDGATSIHPGAAESCNATDDDCDGEYDEGSCTDCDRQERDGVIYLFCEDAQDWTGGRSDCLDWGYDLVVIQDADEDTWLVSMVTALDPFNDWFIGLSGSGAAGHFVWVDGTTAWTEGAPVGYTNFATGAPALNPGEDCVELDEQEAFLWDEARCTRLQPFICEFDPS